MSTLPREKRKAQSLLRAVEYSALGPRAFPQLKLAEMGAFWRGRGGEKGKEVSGDAGAGLRAGNELGTTITLPLLQHHSAEQRRGQRGNDRLG